MTFDAILNAPPYLQIHVASALWAVVTGPVALYRKRRDRLHKVLGYLWVSAMLVVATSSWWISSFAIIGPFSPIHGFALLTYWAIWDGMRAIYQRRIRAHEAALRNLYWNGLLIAGLANFLPGRMVNGMIFGEGSNLGWVVIALGAGVLIWRIVRAGRGWRGELA